MVVAVGPGVKKCSDIGGAEGEFKNKRSIGALADSINLEARTQRLGERWAMLDTAGF
jgi:hypothetical protein